MGWFARTGLSRLVTRAFVRAYGVNLSEAEGELADYPTLEALFTRALKEGARPIDPAPGAIVSPVDGTCAAVATRATDRIEVAPGRFLPLAELVDTDVDGPRDVVVIYLSPKDYHRVHVAREGEATSWRYVPGTLWPVFPAAVRRIDGLFARNERMVVHTHTDLGPIDVVLVGAFGVGRISLSVTDVQSNVGTAACAAPLSPPVAMARGQELGVFHLGSTVILLTPPGVVDWSCTPGEAVRLGEPIGQRREG
jgi:phosphatidylserine decarboxylase